MFEIICNIFRILLIFQINLMIYGLDLFYKNPEESGLYLEGDIKPTRNGISFQQAKWPFATVPYHVKGNFTPNERDILMLAINEYHSKTCIRFRKRSFERDYLIITNKPSGCWSNVGRIGGPQEMNLESKKCFQQYGTILHELMHVLGFYHEQNRYDRDSYVKILRENILPDKLINFEKLSYNVANSYGVSYDYGSIMHYRANSFTKNGKNTIKALKSTTEVKRMGQRDGFSTKDLKKINYIYLC